MESKKISELNDFFIQKAVENFSTYKIPGIIIDPEPVKMSDLTVEGKGGE